MQPRRIFPWGAVQVSEKPRQRARSAVTGFWHGRARWLAWRWCMGPEGRRFAVVWYGCPPLEYIDAARSTLPIARRIFGPTQDEFFPSQNHRSAAGKKTREAGVDLRLSPPTSHTLPSPMRPAVGPAGIPPNPVRPRLVAAGMDANFSFFSRWLRLDADDPPRAMGLAALQKAGTRGEAPNRELSIGAVKLRALQTGRVLRNRASAEGPAPSVPVGQSLSDARGRSRMRYAGFSRLGSRVEVAESAEGSRKKIRGIVADRSSGPLPCRISNAKGREMSRLGVGPRRGSPRNSGRNGEPTESLRRPRRKNLRFGCGG